MDGSVIKRYSNCVTLYGTDFFKVIHSFGDQWLEAFFVDDKISKKILASLDRRLFRKLQLIDDASSYIDLKSPPSNHFERLEDNLSGYCSIRITERTDENDTKHQASNPLGMVLLSYALRGLTILKKSICRK